MDDTTKIVATQALLRLSRDSSGAVAHTAWSDDLAPTVDGVLCHWMPLEELAAVSGQNLRATRAILSAVGKDSALAGVGHHGGLARVPEEIAFIARVLWPSFAPAELLFTSEEVAL